MEVREGQSCGYCQDHRTRCEWSSRSTSRVSRPVIPAPSLPSSPSLSGPLLPDRRSPSLGIRLASPPVQSELPSRPVHSSVPSMTSPPPDTSGADSPEVPMLGSAIPAGPPSPASQGRFTPVVPHGSGGFLRATPPGPPRPDPLPEVVIPSPSSAPTVEDVAAVYQSAVTAAGATIDRANDRVRALDAEIDYHRRKIDALRRTRQEWIDSGARGAREREDAQRLLSFRTAAAPVQTFPASAGSPRSSVTTSPASRGVAHSSPRRARGASANASAGPSRLPQSHPWGDRPR